MRGMVQEIYRAGVSITGLTTAAEKRGCRVYQKLRFRTKFGEVADEGRHAIAGGERTF